MNLGNYFKKNKDYGDTFEQFRTIGILIRISDKISRAVNITKNEVTLIDDEKLRDTLIDLHNYAVMGNNVNRCKEVNLRD